LSKTENHNEPNKRPTTLSKQLLKFTDIAFRMGITIALGAWAGTWLDKKLNTSKPYCTMILTLLATIGAMYMVIRDVSQNKT
jgi:F0F1-type ATP synthase assembly protein I